ncbi:hypothetical protein [Laspinema palackyanum]|uniref:hypothetical protein n=1 Tax=Laspinema palackyanum TaxID=3231601 RepID=UPI00345DD679|nr:hypothetical protein [Laspinema sp. D2c]
MLISQYKGILLFVGDSLREYSDKLGYDANDIFDVNDIITDGESSYLIKSFQVDEELGVVANCEFIDEESK